MTFLNTTETLGVLLGTATTTTTGDMFITLLVLMVFLLAAAFMFRINLEWTAVILLPYSIACAVYYQQFVAVLGVFLIYLTFIVTKNWIFK